MPFLTLMKLKKSKMKTFKNLKHNLLKSIKNSFDIGVLPNSLYKYTYFLILFDLVFISTTNSIFLSIWYRKIQILIKK
jgi:hypothetical protein